MQPIIVPGTLHAHPYTYYLKSLVDPQIVYASSRLNGRTYFKNLILYTKCIEHSLTHVIAP